MDSVSRPIGEHDFFISEFEGWNTGLSETEIKKCLTTECLSLAINPREFIFWTPETEDEEYKSSNINIGNVSGRSIQEKIRFLIRTLMSCENINLVQFWAPKERSILTTLHQPFAIDNLKGLSLHRKKCMDHHYIVGHGADEEQLGPPGRVFRNGCAEFCHNIRVCLAKSFPLRDHAARCGVRSYLALPVFDLHNNQCLGVLEIFGVLFGPVFDDDSPSDFLKALQEVELRTAQVTDTKGHISLVKSVTDHHQRQVNDGGKMDKSGEYDFISNFESGENLQIPETDHTKNVEEQEENIDTNSNEGNKSTTSFNMSYEDLQAHFGKKQDIAANACGVSKSTFKRKCKELGIRRWPSNAKNKKNPSLFKTKTSQKPVQNSDQYQISKPSNCNLQISDFPINSNAPKTCTEGTQEVDKTCQETNVVMIRAKFKKDIVKFELCLSSGLKKVEEEVAKRLNLMIGKFMLKYKDDDGFTILLKCDADLHLYVKCMQSLAVLQVHLDSN